jgi:transposase InsO family protein
MKVISMQTKLAAALAQFSQGDRLDVRATCRELGISPPTFYKYAGRFEQLGWEGLFEESRRPRHSPNQTGTAVEELIVRWRKELADDGWDNGAQSIYWRMKAAGQDPPTARTIHRVLVRRGLVVPAPAKRPRSSYRRFGFARTNDCWQIDATQCTLADGSIAVVFHLIDDCSRKVLNSVAASTETGEAACRCVSEAISEFGVPAMFLSDNGAAFSAKVRGGEGELERILRALGVNAVTSSPYHPQTCGKVERHHQTFAKWLDAQPAPPATVTELGTFADTFDGLYNSERPHSAHEGATPNQVWDRTERCPPPDAPADPSTRSSTVTVTARGAAPFGRYEIQIGRQWQGATVTVITTGNHIAIFHGKRHIRSLDLDPTRRYQPNGKPRGGTRKARIVSTMS